MPGDSRVLFESGGQVTASVEGDEHADSQHAAWCALHQQYVPIAGAFLRKLGVPDADLEDAIQEVFLQMFRYFPSFRGESMISTWLYRLCVTQARRVRRAAQLRRAMETVLLQSPQENVLSAPGFSEQAARRKMELALAELSDAERAVFVLFEMEGVAGKDIAEIVGCREGTVWRRLHSARGAFKRALCEEPKRQRR